MTGCPHPDYLAPYLTSDQLSDWKLYQERVGSKQDWQFGLLSWVIATANGADTDIEEWMPFYYHEKQAQLVANVEAFIQTQRVNKI